MPKPINITSADFDEKVLQSPQPVVVDFWAAWCGPRHLLAPVVEDLAAEYDGRVKFTKLNIDENLEAAMNYRVQSIPTLILFFGGQEIGRFVGFMSKERLARQLEAALPVSA